MNRLSTPASFRLYLVQLTFLFGLFELLSFQSSACDATFTFQVRSNSDSVQFMPSANNSGTHYTWTFGDGTYSTHVDPLHVYTHAGTYYVCLSVYDSSASGVCRDTFCDSVHVVAVPPVCNASFTHYSVNNPDSVHFYLTGNNAAGTTYAWTFGDGATSNDQDPWHLYQHAGAYYVCLTVTNTANGGCTATICDSIHIAVIAPPVCNAHFTFILGNNPDSVQFNPSANPAGTHYTWTFGDGSSSTHVDPWHFYTHSGTYYVCLTVYDSTSSGVCSDTFCDSVHVVAVSPVCNASFAHYSVHNPDSVHFYPTGNNAAGTTYAWTFGDGSTSNDQDPWHFYQHAGAYYVCLTVTNTANGGCTATLCDSIHIAVIAPPVCNAHFTFILGNNPDSVQFNPSANPVGTHYTWTFGDGSSSTHVDPWHFYNHSGTYFVCLTVYDSTSSGVCSDTFCDSVHVIAVPPVCNASFAHYSVHNPDSVHFYPTGNNAAGTTYAWTFGDGSTSNDQDPWHFYQHAGAYYVCLTVTNTANGGCTATLCDSIHIAVIAPPVCNAHFTFILGNNPDSVQFNPSANPVGTHYTWTFGDGTSSTHVDPWHFYNHSGTYYVCLTVYDSTSSGVCSDTFCDSVHVVAVSPVCNASFAHYSVHNPDSVHFYPTGNNAAGTTYAWTFGDGSTSNDQDPWHLYQHAGAYYVCLTVTNTANGGCTATICDSIHIAVIAPPVCNAHFTFVLGNNPDSVQFNPSANPAGTHYTWTFGDGTSSTHVDPWHFYNHSGTYYVCLTVYDSTSSGVCSDTFCDSVHVVAVPPVCNASFAHYSVHNPDSIHFYPTGNNAAGTTYAWTFGDGSTSNDQDPWHFYQFAGTYYVCLTVTDSTSSGTCSATICDSIHVLLRISGHAMVYPNPAFRYGSFNVQSDVAPYTIRIHDGSGRIIFRMENIRENSFSVNPGTLQPGIYYYDVLDEQHNLTIGKLIILQ